MQSPLDLVDTYGRVHKDLRISVTDRCNFRCQYCMPEEGLKWLPKEELLSFEEIYRTAQILVKHFGIDSIRLTGGEPTLRAQLPRLVSMLSQLDVDLALTTNGVKLPQMAKDLKSAGLNRLNISLDSLQPERFLELTRRDELTRVIEGIDAAIEAGFEPLKINMVAMRGINDDEILDFARFGREKGVVVRFIEFMPLDASESWSYDQVLSLAEIQAQIGQEFSFYEAGSDSEPASRFIYEDGKGEFGVIASVTRSFCHLCDRVRLTSDGQFRNCLFAAREYDLRSLLRSGAKDTEIAEVISGAVLDKWEGHNINQVHFIRPRRSMSQIGG